MKHDRERYTRKTKYKYDEGERRRGRPRDYEEIEDPQELKRLRRLDRDLKRKERELKEAEKKVVKQPSTSSLRRPESLRPPAKLQVKAPVKRSAEEIRMIKEDIARRFKENLHAKGPSNEDAD